MKLYARLFLSHLLVIVIAMGTLLLFSELLASAFIREHVEQMVAVIGPDGANLRADLEHGMRGTLTSALLAAIPFAVLIAAVTALLSARRVVRSVALLRDGSHAIAAGEYRRRLPEDGQDELGDLARHFNRMAGTLERVEQGRVELITNVAHELRTPVAALRGFAEALKDGVMPRERAADAILREMRTMERLANDLSLVSRVEAGAVELHPRNFPATELVMAGIERFKDAYEERDVRLEWTVPSGVPDVTADFERALQVLTNLLSNALRHTPSGGRVTLSVQGDRDDVAFTVRDTGSGIPSEHLERIFERFYRVDPARTRGEGSGVGLTIARGLVERMGGTIRVDSSSSGSVFTFTLPSAHG
ncbi:sensor histidine kinase [Deinococcus peraridilitoris]|uniref:histidine kinase n=1 Tax=Deinococcus peraridilitoris (strain DSM 19664 / LMG 22246 / CIP 109416 / KR-200) TaxID=937777 RepID=L0A184_DEIPD|nr:ATP-binding protein [Deinococcus peraridilitoris]AFZ67214.1 signal transduction histidine kinase [Deinococcus peraridilitoris DSM 19664]